ncbi:MAG: exodeoxyribonuclease III [Candidatus Bipolaricaulota bacterium]
MALRVATWNVNSIRARLPALLAWLERVRPDLVGLQETKAPDDAFPAGPLADLGYRVAFRGEKAYNGVALLTRKTLKNVRFGFDDGGPADEARLVTAQWGRVTVVNTYVPQGREVDHPMFGYKLAWFDRLRRAFDAVARPGDPVLWMGDLNVAPEPIDVYDPKRLLGHVCYHPDATAAFHRAAAWGFVDVFRRHVNEPGQYTYFDYRAVDAVARGRGWRVDHLLATTTLAERSTSAWIDLGPRLGPTPSDHTPLLAEFDL